MSAVAALESAAIISAGTLGIAGCSFLFGFVTDLPQAVVLIWQHLSADVREEGTMKRAQKHGRFATRLHWIAAAAAAVLLPGAARAELTHRYSFNIDTGDSIGGASGTLVNGAAVTGGRLVLANNGTNSDPATGQYLDLPNGLAQTSNLTIEFWSTWNGGNNWQRFFDFGYTTDGANGGELFPGQAPASYNGVEYLFVSPRKGSGGNPFGSELREGGVSDFTDSTTGPYPAGEHHVALTIDGAARTMTLYMDGGVVRETLNITRDPAAIDMLNVWIGRSNFRGDAFFNEIGRAHV